MTADAINPSVVSKSILQLVDLVTCVECCKYYIAPETALCGHSLCHSCWSGRRNCPTCAASVTRKSLKLNLKLQALTNNVHMLGEAFEKLFNVKLEEFTLDILEMQLESDPTKNVKEWLACSENHFSAPISSQRSQDIVEIVELSNSKLQIHTIQKKKGSTKGEIKNSSKTTVPQKSQEDWDRIEILSDTKDMCTKNKKYIVGPMDIEPFYFEDSEYTTDHPRRSSRKRELKNDSSHKSREPSVEKQCSKNSGNESKKVKQNWSNVKKMKKEFSKLNRNKSKLNVSIEMFKKSQTSSKKLTERAHQHSPKPCYDIDDNTPNINAGSEVDSLFAIKRSINVNKENDFVPKKTNVKEVNTECTTIDEISKNTKLDFDRNKSDHEQEKKCNSQYQNNDVEGKNRNHHSQHNITNDKVINVPVIKKSSLLHKSALDNCIKITQNDVNPNSVTADSSDDIEISIKIGSTVTNIVIKKRQKDLHLRINTDREVQTSLDSCGIITKRDVSCSPMQVGDNQDKDSENKIDGIQIIQNVQLQPSTSNEKTNSDMKNVKPISTKKDNEPVTNVVLVQSSRLNQKTDGNIGKTQMITSISTKKNTDSADTATANFDITESVEKELSDIMDCVEIKAKDKDKVSLEFAKKKCSKEITQSKEVTDNIPNEMKFTNDLDIFNSGSVKEINVKSLKTYSEILVPTATNHSKKSQKVLDKRNREEREELKMPKNKKQKVDVLNRIDKNDSEEITKNVGNDSEHMNYDAIMSQVFANIDADIKSKTQSRKANSNKIVEKDQEIQSNEKFKTVKNLIDTEKDKQQKYSENIFSVLDKDSEDIEVRNNSFKQVEPDSMQKHIENLLTPGMCHDLVSSAHAVTQEQEVEPMDLQMGTPLVDSDDSDKSVVEETPQKNVSLTKHMKKSDSTNKTIEINKEKAIIEGKDPKEKNNDSQIIRSIINISDTEESGKLKDVTVIDVQKKNTLETPLTINKFVDQIKHNSTPVARKSLNFDSENIEDVEQTLCPTTTQEKEFMVKAFEQTPKSVAKKPLGLKNMKVKEIKKFTLAGSCLTATETANLKLLCYKNGWTCMDKYTKDITHLVVGVDEENKSQRSVKYMCALAASKWIISYAWVEKCLITKEVIDELPFEALDACGEPGPRLSRLAPGMLFEGISFHCMPPFNILDVETLKYIVEAAGGRVVDNIQGVKVTPGSGPALLLAEPEHTQEDQFVYLAMAQSVVPVNFEWVLNCLGTHSLGGLSDLLLCPSTLLPPAVKDWPAALMQSDSQKD